jgi:transglutaminase/protease-like cytokinesis protein 3
MTIVLMAIMPIDALAATEVSQVESDKEFVNEIYQNLIARKTVFTIEYEKKITDILGVEKASQITNGMFSGYMDKIMGKVYAKDQKTSSDHDYLKWSVKGLKWSLQYGSLSLYPTIEFEFEYNESVDQLKKVNTRIKKILDELTIEDATDYKKVKLIHDYVANYANYNLGGTGFSAYAALIQKKAVCQGYSLAVYKLLTEAGIPCRIITGQGNGGSHAWNIVLLNGKWYNLDVTWDDPIGASKISYDYFLKGTKEFYKDHVPDAEFKSASFKKKYNLSSSNYKK